MAAEDPCSDADREAAGAESGEHHDVEGLPDAPGVRVVHAAGRAEAGKFAISHQSERERTQRANQLEGLGQQRHVEYGYTTIPTFDVHNCALKPVFSSSSFMCSWCFFQFPLMTPTIDA